MFDDAEESVVLVTPISGVDCADTHSDDAFMTVESFQLCHDTSVA